jgi:hypothetical protein
MAENVTEIRAVIRSELILASHSRGIIEFILQMLDLKEYRWAFNL